MESGFELSITFFLMDLDWFVNPIKNPIEQGPVSYSYIVCLCIFKNVEFETRGCCMLRILRQ
jgi:hypothetical protein